MVPIFVGMFWMGSNALPGTPYCGVSTTQPVHGVAIVLDYWMGVHEVTQAHFQALMGYEPLQLGFRVVLARVLMP